MVFGYYDDKWEINYVKGENSIDSNLPFIRFKILKNGIKWPCCDFYGKCTNKAYAEVYPFLMKKSGEKGWSYLCRKHYHKEQKRLKQKLPACLSVEW